MPPAIAHFLLDTELRYDIVIDFANDSNGDTTAGWFDEEAIVLKSVGDEQLDADICRQQIRKS